MSNEWEQFGNKSNSSWTAPITFVYGSYNWLNERPIHYCLASLSVRNLWDDVRLMSEIPGVEKWGFEALFQRVIRDDWVTLIKNQYLSSPERLKFFPSVIIALLPCQNDAPLRQYEPPGPFDFQLIEKKGLQAELPGLRLHFPTGKEKQFPMFGQPGILSWDRAKFVAIAIDGQHRISALRRFVPREGQTADSKDLPATFLIFDPDMPNGRDLIQSTREIFIDVNKNAKTVDDSRLILLDDRNFYNRLTRSMILQAYPDGENASVIEYKKIDDELALEIPGGIPQELVDTAAGRESADIAKLKSWQFTSAFILNRAVQYFFFEDRFERFEEILETQDYKTDSESEMESSVARRREDYEDGDDEEAVISDADMLSFRPSVTEQVAEKALMMHRGLLVGVFTAFTPYKDHIARFNKVAKGEDGDLVRSLLLAEGSLPTKPGAEFTTKVALELKGDDAKFRRIKKEISKLLRPNGWEDSLVWYSVFQRGLLYQPTFLRRAMELGRGKTFESREEFAESYLDALNELNDLGVFARAYSVGSKRIWDGIALKIGDSGEPAMDGSDSAAKRTGQLIRLLVLSVMTKDSGGYRHAKANFAKQGIQGAVTAVQNGWIRYARTKDNLAGAAKEAEHYQFDASKHLERVLKVIADANKI